MKTLLQTICVVLVSIGIAIEAYYYAHVGFVFITVGSLAFAISTKVGRGRQ